MKLFLLTVVLLMQVLVLPADAAKLKWTLVVKPPPGWDKTIDSGDGLIIDGSGGGILVVQDSNASATQFQTRMLWISSAGKIRAEGLFPEMSLVRVTPAKVTFVNDTVIATFTISGGKLVRSDLPLLGQVSADLYNQKTLDRLGFATIEDGAAPTITLRRYTY